MSKNQEEKCFCDTPETCMKKGMMDLFRCKGVPIYASLPHFYDCDKGYLDLVDGLTPNKTKHNIKILFEWVRLFWKHDIFFLSIIYECKEFTKVLYFIRYIQNHCIILIHLMYLTCIYYLELIYSLHEKKFHTTLIQRLVSLMNISKCFPVFSMERLSKIYVVRSLIEVYQKIEAPSQC